MKQILVIGSNGQLGSEFRNLEKSYPEFSFIFTDIEELDLISHLRVEQFFQSNNIDICINCAGYTAVDKAEDELTLAFQLNHFAVENLAKICSKNACFLVHISTDYVFDGNNYRPYTESDQPSPNSVYGHSKLKGEQAVLDFTEDSLIIRTSWLYSVHGHNFVKTILRLAKERDQLSVVFDQVGTPTYAADLAKAVLEILDSEKKFSGNHIYNYSNEGVISWFDFAKAIVAESKIKCKIQPIESKNFPAKANRPFYSVLNKTKIKEAFDIEIPYWYDSLKVCLEKLKLDQ